MSSFLNSQLAVLATATAVSGALIFLSFFREKNLTSIQLFGNQDFQQKKKTLRSCLFSDGKKRERKKKRVQFADDNVKKSSGNGGEEYRKQQQKKLEIHNSCGRESVGIPANRVSLYNGILRDRVNRIQCSY